MSLLCFFLGGGGGAGGGGYTDGTPILSMFGNPLGFRVQGSGFRVQGLGFRVWGLHS